jgi:hypothetical protein
MMYCTRNLQAGEEPLIRDKGSHKTQSKLRSIAIAVLLLGIAIAVLLLGLQVVERRRHAAAPTAGRTGALTAAAAVRADLELQLRSGGMSGGPCE